MNKTGIQKGLEAVSKQAKASKLHRFASKPVAYITAIAYRKIGYAIKRQPLYKTAATFFGKPMLIALPAATDIYLTGGKTHDSELRLANFLIQNLQPNDTFWDIGAHFGYFSLLAATLVGPAGKVLSLEAAPENFNILLKNTTNEKNITPINAAASEEEGILEFYTFPILYSEYNSFDIAQYKNEKWYDKIPHTQHQLPAITLDMLWKKHLQTPTIIKIDVEGAEHLVLAGAKQLLTQHAPYVVMEYITANETPQRDNAISQLMDWGYQSYIIDNKGELQHVANIKTHCLDNKIDSENVVFQKSI